MFYVLESSRPSYEFMLFPGSWMQYERWAGHSPIFLTCLCKIS
jgi:hypothetical protein